MRHIVNVMAPPGAVGSRGEMEGKPSVYLKDVPLLSFETLEGRDADLARATWHLATYKIEMYADPNRLVTPIHYLQFGNKRLDIGTVNNVNQQNRKLILLCGEMVDVEPEDNG